MPRGKKLSSRTRKQISDLPKHSQKVYQKAHQRALQHYLVPKRGKEEARVSKKQESRRSRLQSCMGGSEREESEERARLEEGTASRKQ
jgi:hypothetical protein